MDKEKISFVKELDISFREFIIISIITIIVAGTLLFFGMK